MEKHARGSDGDEQRGDGENAARRLQVTDASRHPLQLRRTSIEERRRPFLSPCHRVVTHERFITVAK